MPTHYRGATAEVAALDAYIKLMRAAESVTARLQPSMAGADFSAEPRAVPSIDGLLRATNDADTVLEPGSPRRRPVPTQGVEIIGGCPRLIRVHFEENPSTFPGHIENAG